jgi:hypothetical protein
MKNIKNVGELKEVLSTYPNDSSIVVEVLNTVHDDLYEFYIDHIEFYNSTKNVVGYEIRLTLTQ